MVALVAVEGGLASRASLTLARISKASADRAYDFQKDS